MGASYRRYWLRVMASLAGFAALCLCSRLVAVTNPSFYDGVDISYLSEAEVQGTQYFSAKGKPAQDAVKLLAAAGANIARLRIWNNPNRTDKGVKISQIG